MSASISQLQQGVHKRYAYRATPLRYDHSLLTKYGAVFNYEKNLSINIIFNEINITRRIMFL